MFKTQTYKMQAKEVINYIVEWLDSYATQAKMDGFVIGISGGIDSAVTSTLAAKTGKAVLVIEMPIRQNEEQVNRGHKHIQWLKDQYSNVKSVKIDLTETFTEFEKAVEVDHTDPEWEISLANSRARLRMTTLYYFAGLNRYLVTGTGNKVEDFGVGFFTKYGDGGVDISPIADLMKSEVFELAKELEIINDIQIAAPTDGLWADNRTDEDQMGATYDELEWAMQVYKKQSPKDFDGRKKEVLTIFNRLNSAMQHKITPIPIAEIPSELKD